MAETGKDLWRTSGPNLLLKQVAQDRVQMAFEYLQGGRLHNLPGQLVPVLSHPHREKVFLDVQGNLLYFGLCPLSGPVTGHH